MTHVLSQRQATKGNVKVTAAQDKWKLSRQDIAELQQQKVPSTDDSFKYGYTVDRGSYSEFLHT